MNIFDILEQQSVCQAAAIKGGASLSAIEDYATVDLTNMELRQLGEELRALVRQNAEPQTPILNKIARAGVFALRVEADGVVVSEPSRESFQARLSPEQIMEWADEVDQKIGTTPESLTQMIKDRLAQSRFDVEQDATATAASKDPSYFFPKRGPFTLPSSVVVPKFIEKSKAEFEFLSTPIGEKITNFLSTVQDDVSSPLIVRDSSLRHWNNLFVAVERLTKEKASVPEGAVLRNAISSCLGPDTAVALCQELNLGEPTLPAASRFAANLKEKREDKDDDVLSSSSREWIGLPARSPKKPG